MDAFPAALNETELGHMKPDAKPRKKKIVICCDGTGNSFSAPNPAEDDKNAGQNSNVVKLYTALEIDNDQVGYYHPGVGTMGAPNAVHWWTRLWSKVKGLAFGAGFQDNVLDAYRYLMSQYNDNGGGGNEDEVYIFGFSRGAYTARALAGLLHGYGLLCRGNEGHLPYAWQEYVKQHDHRDRIAIEPNYSFRDTFSHKGFKIQIVGVWDTVSSVGWIWTPMRLLNLSENSTISKARHAISIDEHRCFFQENLWADDVTRSLRKRGAVKPELQQHDVLQVWFAGVHSDVGGSYLQTESELSQTTLRWMLDEVGVLPDKDAKDEYVRRDGKYVYGPSTGIRLNPERYGLIFGESEEQSNDLLYKTPNTPGALPMPDWKKLHTSLKGSWRLLEYIPHLYFNMDNAQEEYHLPLGRRLRKLAPNSLVHHSVKDRMVNGPHYQPANLPEAELHAWTDGPHYKDDQKQLRSLYYRYQPPETKLNITANRLGRMGAVGVGVVELTVLVGAGVLLAAGAIVAVGKTAPVVVRCAAWLLCKVGR